MRCVYCGKEINTSDICDVCAGILDSVQRPYIDKIRDAEEENDNQIAELKRDGREAIAHAIQRLKEQAAK